MVVNLIVIFLTLTFGYLFQVQKSPEQINSNVNRFKYISLIGFILFLQSGLRHVGVGTDTYAYKIYFEETKNLSWDIINNDVLKYLTEGRGKDPGFPFLMKVFQIFSGSYRMFLVFIAMIFFYCFCRFIYYNTQRLNEAVIAFVVYSVMFYIFYSTTGIRQTIGMSVCIYSYEYIKKRKFIKFVLCLALVYTIHKSVIFFFPVYFLYRLKFTKLIYIVSLTLFPIIFALKNQIAIFIVQLYGSEYKSYKSYEGEAGTYTFTFFILFLTVVILFLMNKILRVNDYTRPLLNIFAVATVITPLTYVNPSLMRVVMYFSFFLILILPFIIESFSFLSSQMKKLMRSIIIIMLIALFIKGYSNHSYKFFWQTMFIEFTGTYE